MKEVILAHDLLGWFGKWKKENAEKEHKKKRKKKKVKPPKHPYHERRALVEFLKDSDSQNTYTSAIIHGAIVPHLTDSADRHRWQPTRNFVKEAKFTLGVPIVSNNTGHFIARNQEDIDQYTKSMRSRAFSELKHVKRIQRIFEKYQQPKKKLRKRRK